MNEAELAMGIFEKTISVDHQSHTHGNCISINWKRTECEWEKHGYLT